MQIGLIRRLLVLAILAVLAAGAWVANAGAEPVEDFYRGKTITLIVGYAPGALYDMTARLMSRHWGKYIPGQPAIIVQNMPASSSITAIMHLYMRSPNDGTELGVVSRGYAINAVYNPSSPKYDALRFNPIGSPTSEVEVAAVWHTSPIHAFADLFKPELADQGLTFGATGYLDDSGRNPLILKNLTGANIKIVRGYPGGADVQVAMENGEVEGRFVSWGALKSHSRAWIDEGKIRVLFQMALKKAPDLPNTPFLMDYAKTDKDREALEFLFAPLAFAWPVIAPPDIPSERLAALRRAFDATMKDPAFLADAGKLNIDIAPVTGEAMQTLIQRILSFDPSVIARATALTKLN
jgi:tripartite-type tricarboxylate transporter receptor subunit TctC